MHETINVWSLVSPQFKRVPVVTTDGSFSSWGAGAKIYFLLKAYSKHVHYLSDSDIDKLGFEWANDQNSDQWNALEPKFIHEQLLSVGLQVTSDQLDSMIFYTKKMFNSAISICDEQEVEFLVTPMLRVYRPGFNTVHVRLDAAAEDPALLFIKDASQAYEIVGK